MTKQISADELAEMLAKHHNTTTEALEAAAKSIGTLKEEIAVMQQKSLEGHSGAPAKGKSWGEQFVESDAVKNFAAETSRPGRVRIEMKTTITGATDNGGDLWTPARDAVVMMPKRRLTVRDLLPTIRVTTGSVEYPKQTTRTNNAGMVAETTTKPESALAWSLETAPIRTIAHWIPASRQILDDAPQLRGIINTELLYGLGLKEESQLLVGDGTGQNILGLVPQATAYSAPYSIADLNEIDVIGLAILQTALAEFPADGVVLNPSDWMRMRMLKNSQGDYILGDPTKAVTPVLFGVPLVPTQAMAPRKFLVGNFQAAATLYDRWTPRVEVSTEHDDFFIKNLVAILAEERIGLGVKQEDALVYGDIDAGLSA